MVSNATYPIQHSIPFRLAAMPAALILSLSPILVGLALAGLYNAVRTFPSIRACIALATLALSGAHFLNSALHSVTQARYTLIYGWLWIPFAFQALQLLGRNLNSRRVRNGFLALALFFLFWQAGIAVTAEYGPCTWGRQIGPALACCFHSHCHLRELMARAEPHTAPQDGVVVDNFNYEADDIARFAVPGRTVFKLPFASDNDSLLHDVTLRSSSVRNIPGSWFIPRPGDEEDLVGALSDRPDLEGGMSMVMNCLSTGYGRMPTIGSTKFDIEPSMTLLARNQGAINSWRSRSLPSTESQLLGTDQNSSPATSEEGPNRGVCRFCGRALRQTFVDLGMSPLCESYVSSEQLNAVERFYPLHVYVCENCFLVQLQQYVSAEDIFSDYAYFSSYSDSWLRHASNYAQDMTARFGLNPQSHVVELASNDGYLLQYFVEKGIPALGIEPAGNVAQEAVRKGVPTLVKFFGVQTAGELAANGKYADLLLANNVLAQVPDLNDFVAGMKILLAPKGVITVEFPHLMRLMEENQFDTIYHEHFSYFSFVTAEDIFTAHGLTLFDVEELPTHGGSLRIYARHAEDESAPIGKKVRELRERETSAGFTRIGHYSHFSEQVKETKRKLLQFLIQAKQQGKSVAGYGAPGKGNTLLNYCGIRSDFLDYTVDRNIHKQGKFLPGTHIPILHPDRIRETRPDYVLILPWNLKDEIRQQLAYVREWGGKLVVPIPEVSILP